MHPCVHLPFPGPKWLGLVSGFCVISDMYCSCAGHFVDGKQLLNKGTLKITQNELLRCTLDDCMSTLYCLLHGYT